MVERMFATSASTASGRPGSYPRRMTVSAFDVAAALRARLPGVPTKKLHKLLYYCQGHHLAWFGKPLFAETISAWDMGPVVGRLWYAEDNQLPAPPPSPVGEAELNTVGYVVSRYGGLTGNDLERLTHTETPWQRADEGRRPGTSTRIERDWIEAYFRARDDESDDFDGIVLASDDVAELVRGAQERRLQPARPDSREELQARLDQLRRG